MDLGITTKIGGTPIYNLNIDGYNIWAKAEFLNPSGSVKDRPIYNILKNAFDKNILKKGDTVVEATSGNAGISLAMFASQMGLECVIVMPSNMSIERKKILQTYGAKLIEVNPGDFDGAIKLRDKLSEKNGWFNTNQFNNQLNLLSHYNGTGVEIIYHSEHHCFKPTALRSEEHTSELQSH